MGRKSSIESLPEEIQNEIRNLLNKKITLDGIVEHLRELGEDDVSRSSIYRYKKNHEKSRSRISESREVAKALAAEFGDTGQADASRMMIELVRSMAFEFINDQDDVKSKDIAMLSRSIKEIEAAAKMSTERELKIREEVAKAVAKKAAEVVEKTTKSKGLSRDTINEIKAGILGIKE